MTVHQNFIAGRWIDGADAADNINPSNTGEVVGAYARGSREDALEAIAAAKAAFPAWSRSGIQQRHDILKKVGDEIMARKDELGMLLAREEGKTLPEAVGEVMRAAQIFDFFSGEVLRLAGEKIASTRPSIEVEVTRADGSTFIFTALCRIDTANEIEYFNNGGILHYVLRKLAA